jgi:predicted short-subunit dehydrogenase-like oxidoreductase (DUF2520 family)
MKYGISIIGAGRLGRSLGRGLSEKGWKVHAVVTRSTATARRAVRSIGRGRGLGQISVNVFSAPVLLIAVPDSAIASVVDRLASFGRENLQRKTILHTSGALSSDVFTPLRSLGAAVGSIHPLQTFSGIGIPSLDGRLFVIEGDRGAIRVTRAMTRALGGHSVQLSASNKSLYHAAAVISAGQVLALEESAIRIFVSLGMKRREALKALLPVTRQVLENLERLGPRAAWTGPLARRDYSVIAMHEHALQPLPVEYLDAYRAVNRLAVRVLERDANNAERKPAGSVAKSETKSQVTEVST